MNATTTSKGWVVTLKTAGGIEMSQTYPTYTEAYQAQARCLRLPEIAEVNITREK